MFLQINTPNVVHEAIEGEVVIVNLEKGLYFSIDGVGAALWTRVAAGHSIDELRGWFGDTFAAADNAAADIETFLEQLRSNDLVTDSDSAPETDGTEPSAPPDSYAPPALEVYSDMEELLLLDPIHEVSDEAGWPNAPA